MTVRPHGREDGEGTATWERGRRRYGHMGERTAMVQPHGREDAKVRPHGREDGDSTATWERGR